MTACRHLWQSCERLLAQLGNGSQACLRLQQVHSLADLEESDGPYDAVVVAAGAAAGVLPEVGALSACKWSAGVFAVDTLDKFYASRCMHYGMCSCNCSAV